MIKKYILVLTFVCLIFVPVISLGNDKISGNACYTYGDNESLVQAEQTAKMLAIRNAIESYSVFIESKTRIKNYETISDIIDSVSAEQVRNIKVSRRTQAGRKICYSVQGYVNPEKMRRAIKNYYPNASSDVQLQDNGYVRIIGQPEVSRVYTRLSSEKKYESKALTESDDEQINDMMREKYGFKKDDHYYRRIEVVLMFLKPCTATTISSGDAVKDFQNIVSGNNDAFLPRFRCDYRFKVFATFFSEDGNEIETTGEYIIAYLIDSNKRQTEMLPGEKTFNNFMIPSDAKSWKVWVAK